MSGVNVFLNGYLGDNPTVHKTTEDGAFVSISIATNTGRKDKNGNKITEWNYVRFNGKTGKAIAEYAVKGAHLSIQGELITEEYVDKNGKEHKNKVIRAREFEFLGPKKRDNVLPPPPEETQDEEDHPSVPLQNGASAPPCPEF